MDSLEKSVREASKHHTKCESAVMMLKASYVFFGSNREDLHIAQAKEWQAMRALLRAKAAYARSTPRASR